MLVCMTNCHHQVASIVVYDKTFDEIHAISSDLNQSYCIVLLDSTQKFSMQYKAMIQSSSSTKSVVFDLIDINNPNNEWFLQWLCPLSLPLTCVFSAHGNLIDLIPGSTQESLLYTFEAMTNGQMTNYHYANRFNMRKRELVPLLDNVLKCYSQIQQGVFIPEAFSESLDYPYAYYLKIIGGQLNNDSTCAISAANNMIAFTTPYYIDLYRNEILIAKKIINPKFDIRKEPHIRVSNDNVVLKYLEQDKTIPFEITVYNDGEARLDISKIYLSCSCLKLDTIDYFSIPPKDSVKIHLTFQIEKKGESFREFFITSNAINNPIQHIAVTARQLQ